MPRSSDRRGLEPVRAPRIGPGRTSPAAPAGARTAWGLATCGGLIAVGFLVSLVLAGLALAATGIASSRLGPPAADLTLPERTLLSVHLVIAGAELDRPSGEAEAELELQVAAGETASEVVDRLYAAAVVRNPALLRSYLRYRGLDRGVQAGSYELRGTMTLAEVAEALQSARAPEITFTVPEGWRREQIADGVTAAGFPFGVAEFLVQTERSVASLPEAEDLPSLEGFLFPDTYRLPADAAPEDLVNAMLENFGRRVDGSLRSAFEAEGLDLVGAVTLASIIEREATLAEERPLIAGVFLNRLRLGIRLESDPTVQYALGQQPDGTWWKSPLTLVDLETNSPYNTYRIEGLPPAPISSPGLASLTAVGHPEQTEFLFFRAACDGSGSHVFSRTFEEHVAQACS